MLLVTASASLFSQTRSATGRIQDSLSRPVFGATVRLIPDGAKAGDTLMTRSDVDGKYTFNSVGPVSFTIQVSSLEFSTTSMRSEYKPGDGNITLPLIVVKSGSIMLDQVIVDGTPAVVMKQDTVEYRVDALNLKPDALVEDAIKRIDGAEVDKDGNVTSQGKAVTKIKVDGKEVFGGDMKTITRNLPADAIDKIQIIDDYGDQAAFTGVKDGDPETIINITTRPGRNNGLIFNSTVGGGTEERYQAAVFASKFQGDRNLGITANLNNNGTQIGGGGFGGRNGSFQRGGGDNGGGGDGITTLSSVGLNYNDKWSPKLTVTGAYFYTNSDRNTISNNYSETANREGTIYSNIFSDANNINSSHNLNGRFEYRINPKNLLIVTPFLSYTGSKTETGRFSSRTGVIMQDQTTESSNESNALNFNTNILYNHLFAKPGRNTSLNLNLRNNTRLADQANDNQILYFDPTGTLLRDSINYRLNETENRTFSASGRLIFNEPLSARSRIQVNYNLNVNNYDNSRIASLNDLNGGMKAIDSLSNVFNYTFYSHQTGVNYNYRDTKNEFSVGLTGHPTYLRGNSPSLNTTISRTNFYVAPIFRYQYRYSRTKSLSVNYRSSASEPQFAQLQPVRDVSNPQRPIVGNPDLDNSFSHNLNADYRISNPDKRSSFMVSMQAGLIRNQIVQNVVLIPDVYGSRKQEIRYLNTNGTYNYGGRYNWQRSFNDRQFTVRLSGNINYDNAVSFADNIKNYQRRLIFSQRLGLEINPGTWMELSPNIAFSNNKTNYTLATNRDLNIQTYSFNLDGRFLFLKSRSLILGFNGEKNFNQGYSSNLNTNPLILNTYLEKQFLKNRTAYLRLQAFDIFNQANNITRSIGENGFTDSRTNRLTQYFMLTLNVRINKFAGGLQRNMRDMSRDGFDDNRRGQDREGSFRGTSGPVRGVRN